MFYLDVTNYIFLLEVIALKDQLLPSVSAASEASATPLAQMALGLQQGVKGLQGIPQQLRSVSVQQGIKNLQELPGMQGVQGTLGRVKVRFFSSSHFAILSPRISLSSKCKRCR